MRAVKSVSIDSERRVIITFLDGSTETLYPNCIWCDLEALRQLIKDLLEEKADAVVQTINNVTIATFEDGADEALIRKLLVSIDPIQDGIGDPSPENVRPISGRTGLSVIRTGKNLLNLSGITIPTTALPLYVPIFVGENAVTLSSSAPTNTAGNANLFLLPGRASSGASAATNGASVGTPRTVNAVGGYVTVAVRNHMGVNPIEYNNQLEIGSTASNYESYKGTEVSVNWETEAGTVYGGSFDVVSGKLIVYRVKETKTWKALDHATTLTNVTRKKWTFERAAKYFYTDAIDDLLCNCIGTYSVAFSGDDIHMYIANENYAYIYLPTSTDDSTVIELSYTLADSIEYQLTPQEITTLLGTNNIWVNSSDILELEYVADTKLYIGESQSGTLGSGRQTITKPEIQPISGKTVEDADYTAEKETQEETEDERGE